MAIHLTATTQPDIHSHYTILVAASVIITKHRLDILGMAIRLAQELRDIIRTHEWLRCIPLLI